MTTVRVTFESLSLGLVPTVINARVTSVQLSAGIVPTPSARVTNVYLSVGYVDVPIVPESGGVIVFVCT